MKTILIIGGYGNAGRQIAELLLRHTDAHVVIAGRDAEKARGTCDHFHKHFEANRVTWAPADTQQRESLVKAFEKVDLVLNASGNFRYVRDVIETALERNADYMDIQLSNPDKHTVLFAQKETILKRGRIVITDGGFHPGLPAAMVRYAQTFIENPQSAVVSSLLRMDWKSLSFSASTQKEFVEEISQFNPTVFKNREWCKLKFSQMPKFSFAGFPGELYCTAMMLEELKALPELVPSLEETGFYIAGFNPFTDYVAMPMVILLQKIFGKRINYFAGRFFTASLKRFSKPPFMSILQLNAMENKDEDEKSFFMSIKHSDGYLLTAAPVVACLKQWMDDTLPRPVIGFQGNLVEPERFFADMKTFGIHIETRVSG